MPTVLITGANRGLGLEFARQYAADGWRTVACVRAPDTAVELLELGEANRALEIHGLDVADHDAIAAVANALKGVSLDVLINNAGLLHRGAGRDWSQTQGLGTIDYPACRRELEVNTLSPLAMAEAFVDHLAAEDGGKLVTVSSTLGSIAGNTSGGLYVYRASKAAVNMVMRSLAADLKDRAIAVAALHPGWVRTDMGGPQADLDAPTSVAGLRRVIAGLTPARSGRFYDWQGEEMAW